MQELVVKGLMRDARSFFYFRGHTFEIMKYHEEKKLYRVYVRPTYAEMFKIMFFGY